MAKLCLTKSTLQLHVTREQMELAFAQIIQTKTDYAVQLHVEVRETHFSRVVFTAEDPVKQ